MIEVFTWLVIEYDLRGHQMQQSILFEKRSHCELVLDNDRFYDTFYEHYENVSLTCDETDVLSSSPRPKPRPEGLE